jgi:multidrug efflux pump subunit AcrA (membrane-fusion protein)
VRFAEGQQVRRGQVLVELDGKEARADLAVAEAALSESRSQFNRSRELYATRALSLHSSSRSRRRSRRTTPAWRPRVRVSTIRSSLRHSQAASGCGA